MKTTIKIVGIGERKTGVSQKTQKPYDLVNIAYTYADNRMDGCNATNQIIDGSWLDEYKLEIGREFECVMSYRNYQPYIVAII